MYSIGLVIGGAGEGSAGHPGVLVAGAIVAGRLEIRILRGRKRPTRIRQRCRVRNAALAGDRHFDDERGHVGLGVLLALWGGWRRRRGRHWHLPEQAAATPFLCLSWWRRQSDLAPSLSGRVRQPDG